MNIFWESVLGTYVFVFTVVIAWRGYLLLIIKDINFWEFSFNAFDTLEYNLTLLLDTEIADKEVDEKHSERLKSYRILTRIYWGLIWLAFAVIAGLLIKTIIIDK